MRAAGFTLVVALELAGTLNPSHSTVARERLREIDPGHLAYTSVKPGPGGSRILLLTPIELLDRHRV